MHQDTSILVPSRRFALEEGQSLLGAAWIEGAGAPELLLSWWPEGYRPVLRRLSLASRGSPALDAPLTLPQQHDRPQTTAARGQDGLLSVALTRPGSAMCPLALWSEGGADEVPLSDQRPAGLFLAPRFLRRSGAARPPLAAIDLDHGASRVAWFEPAAPGEAWSHRALDVPGAGELQQALMLRAEGGYLLLTKRFVPGSVVPDAAGALPSAPDPFLGSILPGVLQGLWLDHDLAAVSAPFQPLGAELLFAFDADLVGDRLVVLGTTRAGLSLSEHRLDRGALVRIAQLDRALAATPSSPAVQIAEDGVSFAAIEQLGTASAQLVYGHLPAPA